MSFLIRCLEPGTRPASIDLNVDEHEVIGLYVLSDAMEQATDLRSTILRRQGEHPTHGAILVMEFNVVIGRSGEHQLQVRDLGKFVDIEYLRGEAHSQLSSNALLPADTKIEVLLQNQRRIRFSLLLEAQGARDARAALAGSSASRAKQLASASGALWIVPGAWRLLTDLVNSLAEALKSVGKRMGLSAQALSTMATFLSFALVAGFAWYQQYRATQAATELADQAQRSMVLAEASAAVSHEGELLCLESRQALVDQLGDEAARQALRVDEALEATKAQGVAVRLGEERMRDKQLLDRDSRWLTLLKNHLVRETAELPSPPIDAHGCLAYERLLGNDLPRYALLWHPDPDPSKVCSPKYDTNQLGRNIKGRWGLSSRSSREFGADIVADVGETFAKQRDPRTDQRWSAAVLTSGIRRIQEGLLSFDTLGRPPVAPSQSQLWSLALWSAYNEMPDTADGVLDKPAIDCVTDLLQQKKVSAPPAEPGQPLLPDLVAVALGEVEFEASPTAQCPWREESIRNGAAAALRSVATLAVIDDWEPESG